MVRNDVLYAEICMGEQDKHIDIRFIIFHPSDMNQHDTISTQSSLYRSKNVYSTLYSCSLKKDCVEESKKLKAEDNEVEWLLEDLLDPLYF